MLKKNINYGMYFKNVNKIHTFFMLEPIDIIGLDKNKVITEIFISVKPNKIILLRNSKHVLELPNNYSSEYKIGDCFDKDF